MPTLPGRPDLEQLRRQAKELLRAARAGDEEALHRMRAASDSFILSTARLVIAREYGFSSWLRLKEEVQARTTDLAEQVRTFCEASMRDWTSRAARLLAARPEIAQAGFAPAVVLGDVDRVEAMLARDPGAATRPDPASGWMPLHAVCASRWHRLDPARTDGLAAVARLLLDAGADPAAPAPGGWTPLRCAIAGVASPAVVSLLLDRGAVPKVHAGDAAGDDLYLACFGDDDHESLRLLLAHATNVADTDALSAPISTRDTEGVRLLLEAGADPNRPLGAELTGVGNPQEPSVYAAIRCDCPHELIQLLLQAGADPNASGPDGYSPDQLAARRGRADVVNLLRRHGGRPSATALDLFLAACLRADRAAAQRYLDGGGLRLDQFTDADRAALHRAAQVGNAAAVGLMLDLGFPINSHAGDNGGTALHTAAYHGSADVVQLLLARGADIEARDTTWDSTALVWAMIGSSERPVHNPNPDWTTAVRILLHSGAAIDGIRLSPDDDHPPSAEVAQLLLEHGAPEDDT